VTNLCAQEAQPRPAAQPSTAGATNVFRAKQVLGSKVLITGNTGIGTVDDIVFDDAGNLEYLIVLDGSKLVTVPWEAVRFNLTEKVATVNITADQYKVIPTYTTTTYPSFYTPAYRSEVYKFYSLTPRDLRRLERKIP
jgi:sporulation protein YlmC with PRC-barrel domain